MEKFSNNKLNNYSTLANPVFARALKYQFCQISNFNF
nr:MAG TPA: hypothetical protein [Bacteriophage sp.]